MKFSEKLNEYMENLDCSAKEICDASGLSQATLSRYRSGERTPDIGTDSFEKLCVAIAAIAQYRLATDITEESVSAAFLGCEDICTVDFERIRLNFNALVETLKIGVPSLCACTNYDASTLFRIKNGSRRPSDPESFVSDISGFVAREYSSSEKLSSLASLLSCSVADLSDISARCEKIREWLIAGEGSPVGEISRFLSALDEFGLNEYIKVIHFDELKVPTVPFSLPTTKVYRGLRRMKDADLDFLKATVISPSMQDVTMFSDMPMGEMAKDEDFAKKWMFGMAMLLKKGLHLNMIHDVDRPFSEMMLGLESYIPMYMTGQISPYYLKSVRSSGFLHLLKTSGAAALFGTAVAGHHAKGEYRLTKNREEVSFYNEMSRDLLKKALPLMDIYRESSSSSFRAFLNTDAEKPGKRRNILSSLPLYTADREFLEKFLSSRNAEKDEAENILTAAAEQRARVEKILESGEISDEICELSEAAFMQNPMTLSAFDSFTEKELVYTYEEYTEHLARTREFAKTHPNYSVVSSDGFAFRNLRISINEGNWAMVSKEKSPAIHFVIRHPRLRTAIENFIPPIVEK